MICAFFLHFGINEAQRCTAAASLPVHLRDKEETKMWSVERMDGGARDYDVTIKNARDCRENLLNQPAEFWLVKGLAR